MKPEQRPSKKIPICGQQLGSIAPRGSSFAAQASHDFFDVAEDAAARLKNHDVTVDEVAVFTDNPRAGGDALA
jgi:hypothetical protein